MRKRKSSVLDIALPVHRTGRNLRVLAASSNADRIMLIREVLEHWPIETVFRVAARWEDVVTQFDSHAPDIICWDIELGDKPESLRDVPTLLIDDDGCASTRASQELIDNIGRRTIDTLSASIDQQIQLRTFDLQLRKMHGAQRQMRSIVEQLPAGVVVLQQGRVVFANEAAAHTFERVADDWIGLAFGHEVPDVGSISAIEFAGANGDITKVDVVAKRAVWDAEDAMLICVVDADQRKASIAPKALASDERLRALGRLAAGIAHEVNNPLTFVLANIESLRESTYNGAKFGRKLQKMAESESPIEPANLQRLLERSKLDELIRDSAEMMTDCSKGIQRIQEIARSLGTISKSNVDSPELFDVAKIVDDSCAMVYNQIRYRARLIKRFEPTPLVVGFPGRIAQALVNLLVNAAESIKSGTHDQNRIVVSTKHVRNQIVITVTDTGDGVDESERSKIFEPGFTTKAYEGRMGLGLSLCANVAEQHGGRISCERLEPRGTKFEFALPDDTGLEARTPRNESRRPLSAAPIDPARLLIIDDDAMVLSAFERRLQRRYNVVIAAGGAEALELLGEDTNFDAILCDLMMPDVDGKSFFDSVSKSYPALAEKILFMSGGAFTPRLRQFASVVPNPVMQKPVTREQLSQLLSAVVQKDE